MIIKRHASKIRQKHGSLSVMKLFQFKNLICAEKKKCFQEIFTGIIIICILEIISIDLSIIQTAQIMRFPSVTFI